MKNEIIKELAFKRRIINKFSIFCGVVLSGIIGGVPGYLLMRENDKAIKRRHDLNVAENIAITAKDKSEAKKFLKPYLSEHLHLVSRMPETYETLTKMNMILEDSNTNTISANVSQSLPDAIANGFRVDIGTNSYFSDNFIGNNIWFMHPERDAIKDLDNNTLYFIDEENQRLANPISRVYGSYYVDGKRYIIQDQSLFEKKGKKLVKVADGVDTFSFRPIDNTPFSVIFSKNDLNKIVGIADNEEEAKLKKSLEERLNIFNTREFNPTFHTKVAVYGDHVYFSSLDEINQIYLGTNTGSIVQLKMPKKEQTIVDFLPIKGFGGSDPERLVVFYYTIEKRLFTKNIEKFAFHIHSDRNPSYDIPADSLNASYRLTQEDGKWLEPQEVKARLENYLLKEERLKRESLIRANQ